MTTLQVQKSILLLEVSDNDTTEEQGLSIELPWKSMFLTFVGFWSILKDRSDIRQYVIPRLQMLLLALLEGAIRLFTDITRVSPTLKPQLCLQPWKRWWTTLRTVLDRRLWNQTEKIRKERISWKTLEEKCVRCHVFVLQLLILKLQSAQKWKTHPIVMDATISGNAWFIESSQSYPSTLHATSRSIWIIWAMRCYTSRQGPCQAVLGGMFLLKTPSVHDVIFSYSDIWWIWTMLTTCMYLLLGDWLAQLYHEDAPTVDIYTVVKAACAWTFYVLVNHNRHNCTLLWLNDVACS